MKKTPQGVPYKIFFENLLRDASLRIPNLNFEFVDNESKLWVIKNEERKIIFYGYNLGLNNSSVETVCRDKYLTWLLLNKNEETNKYSQPLEMKFFNGYVRKKFDPKQTLSSELYDLVDKSKKIVLKPVTGKGGDKIYKIETKSQVDNALQVLATKNSFISTKFVPTSREYRVILARLESDDISFLMCLKKEPLKIKGDGKKTIKELIFEKMSNLREGVEMNELWKDINTQLSTHSYEISEILPLEKEINITWRLNQVIGSNVEMINEKKIPKEVLELSKSAFKALGMNFGCVDIVECENMEGNNYLIMEVNTSVLTDLFDHCKYGKLVELTRKSIIKRLNNHDLIIDHKEESDFTEIKKNNLVDKNQLLSYKGKAKLKKKCIEEACKSLDVNVDFYSQDYLAVIDNDIFMVNFDTGINNSISIDVCNDKDITSKILNLSNIPHVEHELFKTPEEDKGAGIMDSIFEKAREWNMNVVVKKRKGSGGSDVHHVKNEIDLEKTVLIELKEVLQKGIVISPYQKIEDEYRVLILNDKALCIYKKNRIFLQGDGKSNLLQLINSQIDKNFRNEIISSLLDENKDLNTVINEDEKLLVSWKHNLDKGTEPEISKDNKINEKLLDIAKKTIKSIGMNYAAVDIIRNENNELFVLEINSTPMFYNFISFYGEDAFGELLKNLIAVKLEQKNNQKQQERKLEEVIEIPPKN